jgi:TonB family protein
MMSAYANSVQKPERFELYVRKFRSICMMHGVKVGSRKELPAFLRKLIEDRHLAMDFWAFVGKLSDREGGELSDNQMLGVIVEGITDCDISEQDGGTKRIIDDLRALLAGVDIQGPEPRQVEMAPFPGREAASQRGDKQMWAHAEELAGKLSDLQTPLAAEKQGPLIAEKEAPLTAEKLTAMVEKAERFDEGAHHAAVLPATPPPQLDEALLRVELTRLVQQYFDNIDKRISKLEPPAEGPMGTIAPAVTRRSLEEPDSPEEEEELRLRSAGRTRLVLEPAPSPVEGASLVAKDDDDIPMRVPLEHYSPPPRFGKAPLLLVLVLVGAAFAIYRDPTLLRKGVAAIVRQFHRTGPVAPSNRSVGQSASSDRPLERSQPSVVQSVLEGTPLPPPANTPEQTTSPAVSSPVASSHEVSQPAGNDSKSGSSRKTAADRAVAQSEQAIADGISSIDVAGAIRVSPAVMFENLIVSRVPAYPEAAKMSGIEGDVVMQALISKEGTVKRLHVLEGDSRLRNAAEEAVYKWRYRPYVLQGRPVEVATTVTVNFNLDRR